MNAPSSVVVNAIAGDEHIDAGRVHGVAAPQSRTILRNQSVVMNVVIKDLNPLSAHSNNSIIPWISENFIVLKDNIMYPGFVAFEFNTIDFNAGTIEDQPV